MNEVVKSKKIDRLFNKAISLIEKGDLNEALAILSAVAEKQPALDVLLLLGKLYKDLGKLPEAIAWFDKAVKAYPRDELSSLALFHALSNNGQEDKAMTEMERFLSIAPSENYESFRAEYYFEQGMLADADDLRILLLTRATRANPKYAEAFLELGKIYNKLGNIIEAEKALRKSVAIEDDGWARLYLGNLYFSAKNWTAAEKEFVEAQKRLPGLATPVWCQADVYRRKGDLIKSEQLYRKAVELQPDDVEALARLGRALLENNKSEEGAKYIRMALKKDPSCGVALKWKKQFDICDVIGGV